MRDICSLMCIRCIPSYLILPLHAFWTSTRATLWNANLATMAEPPPGSATIDAGKIMTVTHPNIAVTRWPIPLPQPATRDSSPHLCHGRGHRSQSARSNGQRYHTFTDILWSPNSSATQRCPFATQAKHSSERQRRRSRPTTRASAPKK